MPIGAQIGSGTVFEDGSASFMSRVYGPDGSALQQADLTSITFKVYDSGGTEAATGTLTIADVVFDTLQTDARWNPDIDTTGYNFRDDRIAGTFAGGGRYTVEYKFTPTSGVNYVFWVKFRVAVMAVLTS
jgi:hypothetical protein